MFCHQCGHENRPGAKFCDQCGASTAAPGSSSEDAGATPEAARTQLGLGTPIRSVASEKPAPADPLAGQTSPGTGPQTGFGTPDYPPPSGGESGALSGQGASSHGYSYAGGGDSMLSVSLRAIGLQPAWRAWTTVIFILGAFTVGGGVLAYFLVGGETEVVGGAEQDDPFLIGAAEPVETPQAQMSDGGVAATPEGETGSAEPDEGVEARQQVERRAAPRSGTASRRASGSARTGSSRVTTVVGGSSASSMRAPRDTGSATNQPTAAGSMDTARDEPPATASTPETRATGDSERPNTGIEAPEGGVPEPGGVEDRDIEMSMYVSRVRFTVRRYYASRAQNCFDRATRNNPTLSGTAVVGLTIGSDGYVQTTRLARNSTGDASLGACLAAQARSWRLPVPPHAPLTVQLPFSR